LVAETATELLTALVVFDEAEANAILDSAFSRFSLDHVLAAVVLPMLAEVGVRWARGELTVAHEHFCTGFARARLLAISRGWGSGDGPLALLACPPGERHDIGLIAFGLALRDRGWRVALFGADTPVETLADVAERLRPAAIVIAAVGTGPLVAARLVLRSLGQRYPLMLGGAGASGELAGELGAAHLGGDPIAAADVLAIATPAR
jgi:methanogenic corrinoid protein MtbC1